MLLGTGLLSLPLLMRRALPLRAAVRARTAIRTRTAIVPLSVALSIVSLSVAWRTSIALRLAVAALFEAALLLSIAMLVTPAVASAAVASTIATTVASTVTPAVTAVAPVLVALLVALLLLLRAQCTGRHRCGSGRRLRCAEQPAEQAAEEPAARSRAGERLRLGSLHWRGGCRRGRDRSRAGQAFVDHGRRLQRGDALHHRLLALALGFGRFGAGNLRLLGALGELVARRHVLHFVQLIVLEALHLVVRRLEVRVGHQH